MKKNTLGKLVKNSLNPTIKEAINLTVNEIYRYNPILALHVRWLIDDIIIEVADRAKSIILMELHEKILNEMKKFEKEPQIIKFLSKLEREIHDAMSLD